MMENVTRRQLLEGVGLSAAALAASGAFAQNAHAEEAPEPTLQECQDAERQAAKAQNRPMDPIKFVTALSTDELDAMLEDRVEVTQDYVTPGGKVIPAVYVNLRNHINRCAAGVGSTCSGDDNWDLFMDFLSVEDAEHLLAMPVTKEIKAPDYARAIGVSEDEASDILNDLADRSWLWRIRRGGMDVYQIMGLIPGIWEWHELWEGQNGSADSMLQFNIDCDSCWGEKRATASIYQPFVHVQACDDSVVEGEVPLYCDWNAALDRFDRFGVMPCQCRTKNISYGLSTPQDCYGIEGAEDPGRIETCVSMGEVAEYFVSAGLAREISRDEAREIMRTSADDGNIIEGYSWKTGGAYCACNVNVCLFANAYKSMGPGVNSFQYLSDMNLAYDKAACIQCGACEARCPMQVIEVDEEGYRIAGDVCFRCGQCATVCPVGARKLVAKEPWESFERDEDLFDKNLTAARLNMALGGVVDFTGDIEEVRAADTFQM